MSAEPHEDASDADIATPPSVPSQAPRSHDSVPPRSAGPSEAASRADLETVADAAPRAEDSSKQKRSVAVIWVLFVLSAVGQIGLGVFALVRAQDLPSDIPGVEVLDTWAWAWVVIGAIQLFCALLLARRTVLGRMLGLSIAGFLFFMWVYLFQALSVQGLIFASINLIAFVMLIRRGSLFTV
jgi:hypothetical protein